MIVVLSGLSVVVVVDTCGTCSFAAMSIVKNNYKMSSVNVFFIKLKTVNI